MAGAVFAVDNGDSNERHVEVGRLFVYEWRSCLFFSCLTQS